jgi:iron complex transport system permease protein
MPMQKSARIVIAVSFCILIVAFLVHVGIGSTIWYKPWEIAKEIFRGNVRDTVANQVIWVLRLPRAIQACLVGAILGISGSALQTLFRNQLAEPYIVGASSGAAIGAALVYVTGWGATLLGMMAMPLAGFVSGLLTLGLVMSLAKRRGVVETPTMLLAGVVVATMLSSLLSFILLFAGEDQRMVLRWLLGSLSEAFWPHIWLMAGIFAISFVVIFRSAQRLNALSLGEEAAFSLGANPVATRRIVLICVTAMTSVTVGAVGIIGFVGLVAPHIARRLVGVDLRASLPLSAILGSLLLLLADAIAQRGAQGAGFPVGIVTSLLGAPVLLILLKKR